MDDNPFAELRRRQPSENQHRDRSPSENNEDDNLRPRSNSNLDSSTDGQLQYNSANDYASAVRAWLWAYQTWHVSQFLTPIYVQQFLLQQHQRMIFDQQQSVSTNSAISGDGFQQQQQRNRGAGGGGQNAAGFEEVPDTDVRTSPFQILQGTRYTVPAFGRRVIAEAIDFILCFIISLLITYVLVEIEFIELDRYEKLLTDQADLKTLIDVTQDLFPIEIGKKIVTSILEALFIAYGFSNSVPPGSTPGKFLMGLKVVRCASVQAVGPRDYRVMTYADDTRVSFPRALLRSLIKNFALGFLFPLCITMYVFQFNRALYDITSGTMVVEV